MGCINIGLVMLDGLYRYRLGNVDVCCIDIRLGNVGGCCNR